MGAISSGRIRAIPIFVASVLIMMVPAPLFHGSAPDGFRILVYAGLSGVILSAFTAVFGFPGMLKTRRRWWASVGVLLGLTLAFWIWNELRMRSIWCGVGLI